MFLGFRWSGPMLFTWTINPVIRRVGLCVVLCNSLPYFLVSSERIPSLGLCSLPSFPHSLLSLCSASLQVFLHSLPSTGSRFSLRLPCIWVLLGLNTRWKNHHSNNK